LPATYHPSLRKPELPPKPLELPSPGSELQGFAICDATRRWVNAQAKIEGATVVVWSDAVKQPTAVRYAWADHPICNLQNAAGLPAFPFRTDSFPRMDNQNR
jgi:sialate O-acetylesterase